MKSLLATALVILFSVSIFAQTTPNSSQGITPYMAVTPEQNKALADVQRINQQVITLYKEKKYDEALTAAKSGVDMATKANIANDIRALPAFTNMAEVYLAKGNESEAIRIFQNVADAYGKMGAGGNTGSEKTLLRLSVAYENKRDWKNAEAQYLKVLALDETIYGAKSKQIANINLLLANLYQGQKKNDQADAFYIKAIELNDTVMSEPEKDNRTDLDTYRCFCYHRSFQEKGKPDDKAYEEFQKKRGADTDKDPDIVNGKAIKLVKPAYPDGAKVKGGGGFAIVEVVINEQGNVDKAKATCGFLDFVKEVEAAAYQSKFSPTLLKGDPVKVTGYIVYNFQAH